MLHSPKPAGKGALVPAGGDIWGHGGTKAIKVGDGVKAGGAAKSFRFLFGEEGCYHSGAKPGEICCSGLVKFWGGALKARNRGRGFSGGSCRGFGGVLPPLRLMPSPVLGVFLNTAQGWQGAGFGAAGFGVVLAGGARQPLGRKGTSGAHFLLLSTLLLPLFFPLVPAERKTPERSPSPRRWHRSDLSRFRVGFDEHTRGLIQMSRIKQHLEGFTPFFLPMCAFSSHLLLPACSERFPPGLGGFLRAAPDLRLLLRFFGEDFCSLKKLGGRGGIQENRSESCLK